MAPDVQDPKTFESALLKRFELHMPEYEIRNVKVTKITNHYLEGLAKHTLDYENEYLPPGGQKWFKRQGTTIVEDKELCEGPQPPPRYETREVGSFEYA